MHTLQSRCWGHFGKRIWRSQSRTATMLARQSSSSFARTLLSLKSSMTGLGRESAPRGYLLQKSTALETMGGAILFGLTLRWFTRQTVASRKAMRRDGCDLRWILSVGLTGQKIVWDGPSTRQASKSSQKDEGSRLIRRAEMFGALLVWQC